MDKACGLADAVVFGEVLQYGEGGLYESVSNTETAAQTGGDKQNEGSVPQAPGEDNGAAAVNATNEPREDE